MTHLKHSSIPTINPDHLCEAWKLCSVRENAGVYMIAVKYNDGKIIEIPLKEIVDAEEYQGSPIVRTYSSGCVFIDENKTKVFLVTVDKKGKIQHQFTGGSPLEVEFSDVITKTDDGRIKVDLWKIEDNAVQRTKNRTGAEPTVFYNEKPLVDRVLQETQDDEGKKIRRLVLLMHFVVKTYEGKLDFNKGIEDITDGKRYDIESLKTLPNAAANAYLVSKKALEVIK